ncbi:MAG: aryl-sulfate sulfotransferase [Pseudomonadota bacterium]
MRAILLFPTLLLAACGPALEPEVSVNPVCSLSAVVTWTTSDPASSWVEVGQEGEAAFRVGDYTAVTEHRVIVVGMHAEEGYQLEALSVTEGGRELRAEAYDFATGAIDPAYLQPAIHIPDPAAMQPGWTIANASTGSYTPITPVIFDEGGRLVWYYVHDGDDGGADMVISWLPESREVLVGPHVAAGDRPFQMDLAGEVSWLGPEQPGEPDLLNIQDGQLHHVWTRLENGDTVTVIADQRELDGDQVQGDRVVELTPEGEEAWSWSAFDHLVYDPDDVFMGIWWTHLNSVNLDEAEGLAYVNSWVQAKAWKIDRASGEILWTLGEGGDFAPDPDADEPWFANAHSFDPIGDGHYLFYDNGDSERHWSRVVEYALDEGTLQAELVWQYPEEPDDDRWYVMSGGDVDLLGNDNLLVVANERIIEVTREREIVWQLTWQPTAQLAELRSYQASRIPSLVEPIE